MFENRFIRFSLFLQFFRPVVPVNIRIIMENSGRASGEADVEFGSHEEAVKAMTKVRHVFNISLIFMKKKKKKKKLKSLIDTCRTKAICRIDTSNCS